VLSNARDEECGCYDPAIGLDFFDRLSDDVLRFRTSLNFLRFSAIS
jgi:hypothetical protein